MTPEYPSEPPLGSALDIGDSSGGEVISLTFIVAHGFLCHQLNAAAGHHIMELVQEQEPAGAKGRDGEGWAGGATGVSGRRSA